MTMFRGGALLAIAKACGKADDKPEEMWTEFLHIHNVGNQTIVEAADGDVAARYTMDADSNLHACVKREDVGRLYGKDEVHAETVTRPGGRRGFRLTAGGIEAEMVSDDGKDQLLQVAFPSLDDLVFSKRPTKQIPAFACDVKMLKQALGILHDAGATSMMLFTARSDDDPLFLVGVTEMGREVQVAVRRGARFGRKEGTAEVTEPVAPAPLLDGQADETGATSDPPSARPSGARRFQIRKGGKKKGKK